LFYDFLPNGNLDAMLHEGCTGLAVEWETRLKIALGVAEGLAYLHHDCVPAILHRDVKAQNILLGDRYEACLADFGFARFVEEPRSSFSANPHFAGSYGYIAPGNYSNFCFVLLIHLFNSLEFNLILFRPI
jgi:serine/threonine protein kinase